MVVSKSKECEDLVEVIEGHVNGIKHGYKRKRFFVVVEVKIGPMLNITCDVSKECSNKIGLDYLTNYDGTVTIPSPTGPR